MCQNREVFFVVVAKPETRPEHVNILADCLRRSYKGKYKLICMTDNPEGLGDDITAISLRNSPDNAVDYLKQLHSTVNHITLILEPETVFLGDVTNEVNKVINSGHISSVEGAYSFGDYQYEWGNSPPTPAKIIIFDSATKPWMPEYRTAEWDWIKKNYRHTKRAIVLGSADTLQSDLDSLGNMREGAAIFVINHTGFEYPIRADYWVTLHPECWHEWLPKRQAAGLNMDFKSIGYNDRNKTPKGMDRGSSDWGGMSGLFAVKCAFEEGFEEVILCGVPMTDTPYFWGDNLNYNIIGYRKGWEKHLDKLKGRVYSQSGWTAELLGKFM
jgi:hypothetical protein